MLWLKPKACGSPAGWGPAHPTLGEPGGCGTSAPDPMLLAQSESSHRPSTVFLKNRALPLQDWLRKITAGTASTQGTARAGERGGSALGPAGSERCARKQVLVIWGQMFPISCPGLCPCRRTPACWEGASLWEHKGLRGSGALCNQCHWKGCTGGVGADTEALALPL